MSRNTPIAAAASVTLLAGCGGTSSSGKDQFRRRYRPAVAGLGQTAHAVGTAIGQSARETDAQIRVGFQTLAADWQTHLSQLQALKPPSPAVAIDRKLGSG